MFTSIAQSHRAESPMRQLTSFGTTSILLCSAFSLIFAFSGPVAALESAVAPLTRPVELLPPGPPALTPRAPKGGNGEKARLKDAPQVPGVVSEPSPVPPEVVSPVVPPPDSSPVAGLAESGGSNSTGGGAGDGPEGPEVGGGGGGGTGDPARPVHYTDLQVKTRVNPRFPEAARTLSRRDESCVLRILVDERGEPAAVTVRTCPAVFQTAAIEAASQWRWYPLLDRGQPIPAQFDLGFVFRLSE